MVQAIESDRQDRRSELNFMQTIYAVMVTSSVAHGIITLSRHLHGLSGRSSQSIVIKSRAET
jgi:hypothetical protein